MSPCRLSKPGALRAQPLATTLGKKGGATTPPAAGGDKAPAGQKYALLVGVKTYIPTELKNLNYTENDVTELAAALVAGGYPAPTTSAC